MMESQTNKRKQNKTAWQKTRKFLNDIHLWLGLSSGIIVFLVCLSGTIYVFNTEFREMANPELFEVNQPSGAQALPVEQLIDQVKQVSGGKVVSVKVPADPKRAYHFMVQMKEPEGAKGAKGGAKRPSAFAVNPYTGEVLGNLSEVKNFTTELMKDMFSLHRWLLLDRVEKPLIGELENRKLGSYISGTATILFTIGVITGIVIWVPRKVRCWRQGLTIKWSGSWKRKNHDLHNSLGFYACIFLFLMGITGPQWSFPWYRDALRKTLGTYQSEDFKAPKAPESTLQEGFTPEKLTMADYIAAANRALPYVGDHSISLPKDSASAIVIQKNRKGFFAPSAGDKLLLDQYTAGVLEVDVFRDKPFNERVSGSIKALHLGDVYGLFSKIIYFLACLIATSLPITGTFIWINKMKKNKKPARRLYSPELPAV